MNERIPYEITYEDTINKSSDYSATLHGLNQRPKEDYRKKLKSLLNRSTRFADKNKQSRDKSTFNSSVSPRQSTDTSCRACGKVRHDIFKTDCDQFVIYCKCKSMDSQITDKQREKTMQNFEERQKAILSTKKHSQHSIRKLIAAISDDTSSELINEFKEELVDQYREKYPDDETDDIFQQSDSDNESETF